MQGGISMNKYQKMSLVFAVSYAVMLIILLIEFFLDFFKISIVNYQLLIPILSGTFVFSIFNTVIKEKENR